MTKEVEVLIKLGKDEIVASALKSIGGNVSLENFSSATVLTNGKEVYVSLRNQYKYLPINTIYYFDVGVNITTQTTYKNSVANPYNYSTERTIPYFKSTEDINKHIDFVKHAIGNLEGFEDDLIIRENEDFYAIEVVSESQESSYKIKKGTGEIYDEFHAHLEPIPFDIDDAEEFKEVDFPEILK
ncbi:hypothetical protein QSV08_11540 [Maribacter sp. BPC-D8]|uniref:hypothetical protein n=1 Tax=Maribacter sp. BPC-D8 TaxID=3053613 RepID=UPI002B483149|nr:hypothetical protein [Maribacter sp. BPC-D8]WRI27856.1 hypothetical protein QSV08_11540 [Maribacter sp. BPC-D8]